MIGKVRVRVEKKKGPGSGNRQVFMYGREYRWPPIKPGEKTTVIAGRITEAENEEIQKLPGSRADKVRAGLLLLLEEAKSQGLLDEENK
jgi:hypothetical protein